MKRLFLPLILAIFFAGVGAAGIIVWPIGKPPQEITLQGDVNRGAYLARMSGCIACHTNTEKGGAPLAGAVELKTDFGTFFSANLTTDPEFGIGDWEISDFAKAVRQGIAPDGTPYYPAFTYPFYASFTDQDIADLWAAFKTVPPVATPTEPHTVSFPFDQRWGLKLWRAAFLEGTPITPDPTKSDDWNRGRFIVQGPAHCGACHTPRNIAGGRILTERLKGSGSLPGGGKSPDITAKSLKSNGWTIGNLAYALKTGVTPSGDAFGSSMGEAVQNGLKYLTDEDLNAIAVYLLDEDRT